MTVLDGQAAGIFSAAWPFANDLENLQVAGGDLTNEQVELYERVRHGEPMAAMAVSMVRNPRVYPSYIDTPLYVADEHMGIQYLFPLCIPRVALVDWRYAVDLDEMAPDWRLFPSLPGRLYEYKHEIGHELGPMNAFRLWDLWPLKDTYEIELVQEAVSVWWESNLSPYLAYVEAEHDPRQLCEQTGTPATTHRHSYDHHGELEHCYDGDAWSQYYRDTSLVFDHRSEEVVPAAFAPVHIRGPLNEVWEQLYHSSRANLQAALRTYSEGERDAVLHAERQFGTWSWL